MVAITPELVLKAYTIGVFPMAESRDDERLFWVDPPQRGILPLTGFHLPRRLKRTVRSGRFRVTADRCFEDVLAACRESRPAREDSWINDQISELYTALYRLGFVHSIEVWLGTELVGGLYGVSIGAAFFGESMFSRETDASKVALVHLVGRLILGGYRLLDTQFVTDHLTQFGTIEVPREVYQGLLAAAIERPADFHCEGRELSPETIVQSITQTS
ncbi:MAG: leucyl/phenylalanyl-tRNA--protein transferase [Alphaproteobacteria bacterium]